MEFCRNHKERRDTEKTKDAVKNLKDDEPDLNFTILENGKVMGGIATRGFADSPTDAMVQVDVPNATDAGLEQRVKDLFLKLVKRDYFYDNIYFLSRNKVGNFTKLGKRYQIAGIKKSWIIKKMKPFNNGFIFCIKDFQILNKRKRVAKY